MVTFHDDAHKCLPARLAYFSSKNEEKYSSVRSIPRESKAVCFLHLHEQKIHTDVWFFVLVDKRSEKLKQLRDYLVRFWNYYNSSPSLQKALATT